MKTYKEWNLKGRKINKGESHIMRNDDGEPLFDKGQTSKKSKVAYVGEQYSCTPVEDDPTYKTNMGRTGHEGWVY